MKLFVQGEPGRHRHRLLGESTYMLMGVSEAARMAWPQLQEADTR